MQQTPIGGVQANDQEFIGAGIKREFFFGAAGSQCQKNYEGKGLKEDGSTWSKTKSWFGYKLHTIADAKYELPVSYTLTKASEPEQPSGLALFEVLTQKHPDLIARTDYFLGDKGYDGSAYHIKLWDDHQIKCVIDIRQMWKDGEEDRVVSGCQNVTYDSKGNVFCYCMKSVKRYDMAFGGFEKDRECLKYKCPAKHYGLKCASLGTCEVGHSVRIKLDEDRRIFTPLARSSYRWPVIYKQRTSIERIYGRMDTSFGFENHYIRGQKKMHLRVGLSFIVMLAMAAGRIKQNQAKLMRSLVKPAA